MDTSERNGLLAKLQQKIGNIGVPDESPKTDEKKEEKKDNGHSYSRSTNLSALYGIIVVLVGLVVPMTEALRGDWMSSHLIAVFLTFLYTGSSVFIGYMHVHETILKRASYKMMQTAVAAKDKSDDSDASSDHSDSQADVDYDPQETYNRFHALREKTMNNNLQLGMIAEESDNSDTDNAKGETISTCSSSSSSSSSSTTVTIEDNRPRRVTFAPALMPSSGPSSGAFRRRRFSTVPSMALSMNLKPEDTGSTETVSTLDETPDDVFNYIAMNNATATMADDGTNFFMKGGSLIFAVANIVYIALRIEGEHQIRSVCHQYRIIYPHYLHMGFIIMQSFFLLKECQFVYRQNKLLVRFGLIHLIATNLCVWLRYLMIEVDESLMHQQHHDDHHATDHHIQAKNDTHTTGKCEADPIMFKAGPYLFPFVLEYSLVASSTAAFIYSSINIRVSKELYRAISKAIKKRRSTDEETPAQEDYDDPFSKSHMGLFAGVVVFACVIISTIFFFYWTEKHTIEKATLCYRVSETLLMIMLVVATVIASVRFAAFEVNLNQSNTLDHGLLLVSFSLYAVHEGFKLVSTCVLITNEGSNAVRAMALTTSLMTLIQCISQTVFIIDGMQRVAQSDDQRHNKYGRGAVTFMIITNVAVWVFKSFQEKRVDSEPELNFYGEVAWTIIKSTALPLILFYRFHSSICLAHMWGHCYKKHEENLDSKVIL